MNYLKLKKILAIVCVICQLSLLFSLNFAVSADTDYADSISKLTNFGLFVTDDQMYKTDDILTRESLTLMLADFCGLDRNKVYPVTGIYSDVDKTSVSAGIMELVGTSGIIPSYSDGLYRPSNPATFGVVVKAFINIAGYTPIANLKGGWPNGYIEQAAELGITDGVYKQYNDSVTKGEFAQMLFNFLSVDMMRTTSVANGNASKYEVLEGRTIATEKLNLYEAEGVLSATDITSLTGEEFVGVGKVIVNGIMYETDKDLSGFLGEYVELYYIKGADDDYGKIVNIETVEKRNITLVVNDEDISDSTTVTEFVYSSGKTTKTVEIAPDATMIFNGVRKVLFNANDLKPASGSIKLIDNNRDNVYDVIVATHYFDYVVNLAFLDDTNLVISDQIGKASVSVDVTDKTKIAIYKDGVADTIACLKEGTVASVAADQMNLSTKTIGADSTRITIHVSDAVATGTISGLTGQKAVMDGEEVSHYTYETITFGGKDYYFSPEFDFLNNKPVLATDATAIINYKGKIVSLTRKTEYQYGVIADAAAEGGLDSEFVVKMFNSAGKIITMNCVTPLYIDGVKCTTPEKMVERLQIGSALFSEKTGVVFDNGNNRAQLVKYKTDLEKKIVAIDTCYRGENEIDSSLTWSVNIASGGHKYDSPGTFTDKADNERAVYYSDTDTVIFKVPTDTTNEKLFSIMNKSNWGAGNNQVHNLKVFDLDEFNYVSVAFLSSNVVGETSVDVQEDTNIAVATDSYKGLNEDGETVTVVSALSLKTAAVVELFVPEDVMGEKVAHKGSIIRWEGTPESPTAFQVVASVVDGVVSGEMINVEAPALSYYRNFRVAYGTIVDFNDQMLMLRVEHIIEGVPTIAYHSVPLINVLHVFDIDTDSSNDRAVVTTTSKSSFKAEVDYGTDASKVLFYMSSGKPSAAVIYR